MGVVGSRLSNKEKKKTRNSTNIDIVNGRNGTQEAIISQQRHSHLGEAKIRLSSSLIPSNSVSIQQINAEREKKEFDEPLRNNTSDKHLNTILMHKLLTFGWIRKYCHNNNNNNTKEHDIVELNKIFEICFEFIYIERILFCFITSQCNAPIQAIDIHNMYNTQYQSERNINIGYDTNGICISYESIQYPKTICSQYNINSNKYEYHTIFKCGSQNNREAKAIIMPKNQFLNTNVNTNTNTNITNLSSNKSQSMSKSKSKNKIKTKMMIAYEWLLPPILTDIASYGNCVSFSSQHGLISIGGTQPDIFLGAGSYSGVLQLKWWDNNNNNNNNNNELLKWKSLRRMNTGRAHGSSTFFIDAAGNEQLFVCGGDLNGSVEIYNFLNNQWIDVSNTNVSRECAGIYYDKYQNEIFLGGGHGAQKKIECYDIYKDEWNIFPNTNCNHDFYPSLFISSYHYDILYIISPKSNLCEYIDKRQGKKWNILYDKEIHDKLFKIPNHVDFEQFRFIN